MGIRSRIAVIVRVVVLLELLARLTIEQIAICYLDRSLSHFFKPFFPLPKWATGFYRNAAILPTFPTLFLLFTSFFLLFDQGTC